MDSRTTKRPSFTNVKKLIETRLKKRYRDAWVMYHMIVEHHWKPSEIFRMQPWEIACVIAVGERQAQELERLK